VQSEEAGRHNDGVPHGRVQVPRLLPKMKPHREPLLRWRPAGRLTVFLPLPRTVGVKGASCISAAVEALLGLRGVIARDLRDDWYHAFVFTGIRACRHSHPNEPAVRSEQCTPSATRTPLEDE